MKLALIALSVEISLARLVTGSWAWAVAIVVIYCLYVYIRETIRSKQDTGNYDRESEYAPTTTYKQQQKGYMKVREAY